MDVSIFGIVFLSFYFLAMFITFLICTALFHYDDPGEESIFGILVSSFLLGMLWPLLLIALLFTWGVKAYFRLLEKKYIYLAR